MKQKYFFSKLHSLASATRFPNAPRSVGWVPPMDGIVMVNVDGSSLGNLGCAGCGAIVRDTIGAWLRGSYCFIDVASLLEVISHFAWSKRVFDK